MYRYMYSVRVQCNLLVNGNIFASWTANISITYKLHIILVYCTCRDGVGRALTSIGRRSTVRTWRLTSIGRRSTARTWRRACRARPWPWSGRWRCTRWRRCASTARSCCGRLRDVTTINQLVFMKARTPRQSMSCQSIIPTSNSLGLVGWRDDF